MGRYPDIRAEQDAGVHAAEIVADDGDALRVDIGSGSQEVKPCAERPSVALDRREIVGKRDRPVCPREGALDQDGHDTASSKSPGFVEELRPVRSRRRGLEPVEP